VYQEFFKRQEAEGGDGEKESTWSTITSGLPQGPVKGKSDSSVELKIIEKHLSLQKTTTSTKRLTKK